MTGPDSPPGPAPDTDEVLSAAREWLREGKGVALATVVSTWGSSPRRPGSQLVVADDRSFLGSVSGGCVEGAVIEEGVAVIASGEPKTLDFGVSDEEAWEVGLACGGRVEIRVEPVEADLLDALLEARRSGRPAVLATDLTSGSHQVLLPFAPEMEPEGELGEGWSGPVSTSLRDASRESVLDDTSRTVDVEEGRIFLRVYNPALRMVVVGAVHIAQPLARMATAAGFEVTVVDPRRAFATRERFPGVRLLHAWPDEAFDELAPDRRTAVVTLTHDPKLDDPALRAALASPVFYLGALGSRRTHQRRLDRLREAGVDEGELGRVRGPVGLDIGARTPAEIAVAILAEVVAVLRRET